MSSGDDYAWDHPSIAALLAAGIRFVCRYLSYDASKNLSLAEATALHAAGIATVSNWEYTAGAAKNGFDQGVADAKAARDQHKAAGGPADRPIYFSVDFDVPDYAPGSTDPAAKLGPVAAYFRGVASVIGLARTGAYGGYWAISRLFDAKLITWGWQTYAWSGSPTKWDGRAQIRQIKNGVAIGGADTDLDQSMVTDFGQWPIGADMEQSELLTGYRAAKRTVGDTLADVSNERDWWYNAPGTDGNNPPPPGSRADLVLKAAQAILAGPGLALTDAQAEQLAAAIVAHPDTPLGKADEPAIIEAVKQVLRDGTGS